MSKNNILNKVFKIEEIELGLTIFNSKRSLSPIDKELRLKKLGECHLIIDSHSPKSPYYNRVKGFGMNDIDKLDQILDIYSDENLVPCFDISPNNMNENVSRALNNKGFISNEQLVFMELTLLEESDYDDNIRIVKITEDNSEEFINIIISSNKGMKISDEIIERKKHYFFEPNFHNYIAYIEDKVMGIGSLFIRGQEGYIANDFTFPEARNKKCQKALLSYRINEAKKMGLTSLFTDVEFGSISHNNMEKLKFKTIFINSFWIKLDS